MAIKLTFNENINVSAQVGDVIYANTTSNEIGVINEIDGNTIVIDNTSNVNEGDFIMFRKNNKINLSGLNGYFAEAIFETSSVNKKELFSTSSEITPSSK
jgi:hypothetical protein